MVRKAIINIVLLLAANAVLAHPSVISHSGSQVTKVFAKRDSPSPYPGNQGAPCTNEPSYLGFDYSNSVDANKVELIHKSFCSEVGQLIVHGELQVDDTDTTVFGRYFDGTDGEAPVLVSQVFQIMWDTSNGNAGVPLPLVNTFIFDNSDYNGWCPETGSNDPSGDDSESSSDDGPQIGGYTDIDVADNLEKIHFCDSSFRALLKPVQQLL